MTPRPQRDTTGRSRSRPQRHPRGSARGLRRASPKLKEHVLARRAAERTAAQNAKRGSDRRLTFTGRAAVLALVLCAVLATLAYPLKAYLDQRSEIGKAAAQQHDLQNQVDALTKEHQQAQDPAVVEQQARERLRYTMPGQQNYVILAPPTPTAPTTAKKGHASVPLDPGGTWYDRLWRSAQTAAKR